MQTNDVAAQEFAHVEYKEACSAYFHGVDIGYTVVRHYATVNALLVILIGTLATTELRTPVLPSAADIVRIVPWIAIVFSLALAAALPHYWSHLRNCRDRCVEIESAYGGQLFTRLATIETGGRFGSGAGLNAIIFLVLALWLAFAFRDQISVLASKL